MTPRPGAGAPHRSTWSRNEGVLAVVVAQLALIVGGATVATIGGWELDDVPIGATFAATIPFWAAIAAMAWIAVARYGRAPVWGGRPTLLESIAAVGVGAALQVLAVPALYWLVFAVTGTDSADLDEPAQRLGDAAGGFWGAVALVALAGIGAPIFEELLYRGLFLSSLVDRWGESVSIALSALVFAALHFQLLQLPGLAMLGVVAGWFRVRRGGTAAAVLVHMSFNLVTVVSLLG